jgi:hypothetical protein
MASQQPERHPPLNFSRDPWRRAGTALLVSGLVLLAALMVADVAWSGEEDGDGAVAPGSAQLVYWFDLVFVVTLSLGLGAALAGLVLLIASLIPHTASRTKR